jgi:hypothetical protein
MMNGRRIVGVMGVAFAGLNAGELSGTWFVAALDSNLGPLD